MKVGTHKKSVLLLWAVLLASTSFGVYKNFTAIDTHTVHEKEIIQLRLNDTNGIENFVKNFAKAYYSWDTSKEAIEARTTEISKYLTKELQDLNADTIRTDIPTSATVTNVLVWNIEQSGTDDFTVAYEVDQQVKEGEQTQAVTENYTVTVHVDKDGAMVITQNPTLAPAVQKSKYEPKVQEADVSVSSDTVKDATAFLETFFKLYPTATEKELAYYVKDGVLEACTQEFSKHHVVPEIEEVKQQTENDDDTEHQHVLASPLYFLWLCCYLVTLVTASTTVLCCQDESVNDVTNCQSCQT